MSPSENRPSHVPDDPVPTAGSPLVHRAPDFPASDMTAPPAPLTSSRSRTARDRLRGRNRPPRIRAIPIVIVIAVTLLLVAWFAQHLAEGPAGPANSRPDGRLSTGPTPPPSTSTPETSAPPDLSWTPVGGVLLPASRLHGPWITAHGRTAGYSRSEAGAALAAVQVLLRTSPTAGPGIFLPVLTSQVTGVNVAALKQTLLAEYAVLRERFTSTGQGTPLPPGAPIPGVDARVVGYRLDAYDQAVGTALVEVVLDSPALRASGRDVTFAVSLRWSDGDWRVLAPPRGDGASVATVQASTPPGMQRYDDLGQIAAALRRTSQLRGRQTGQRRHRTQFHPWNTQQAPTPVTNPPRSTGTAGWSADAVLSLAVPSEVNDGR